MEDLGQELQNYEHLQHLNLSKNGLRDIASIAYLNHLLTVNVSTNAIGSIKFLEELADSDRLQFLQVSIKVSNLVTAFLSFSVSTSVETKSRSCPEFPSQDYPG